MFDFDDIPDDMSNRPDTDVGARNIEALRKEVAVVFETVLRGSFSDEGLDQTLIKQETTVKTTSKCMK